MTTLDGVHALQLCVPKANFLGICDLPEDILILILSSLHGQDVARCIQVCHGFSDVICVDLSLQYSLELAMNGMVDGEHSTLPVYERLQRLRQYSSDFSSGAFHRQDLTAHPDYLRQQLDLLGPLPRKVFYPYSKPSGAIYTNANRDRSALYLSQFIPGSAQCGILSSRSMFSVRDGVKPDLVLKGWTVDDAQDLFVMVEMTRTRLPTVVDIAPSICLRFYSLSRLKIDSESTTSTSHPAALVPAMHLHALSPAKPITVSQPQIVGSYLILEIQVNMGTRESRYYIDVYNWKTGEMISRTDVGKFLVTVVPLDEPYLLVFPSTRIPERHPDLKIFSFAPPPSSQGQGQAGRHICTLELPPAPPGERVAWSQAKGGDRSSDESTGHFRADAARSVVSLYLIYEGIERTGEGGRDDKIDDGGGNEDEEEEEVTYVYATHILVPRATLAAQIQAAESVLTSRHMGSGTAGADGEGSREEPELRPAMPLVVPWADWGSRGTLRLYQRGALFDNEHIVVPAPFGSRFPFVVAGSDSDSPEESAGAGGVYVFDVNPLVARSSRGATRGPRTAIVDAEDIGRMLPGVVDPESATIPYVVYRFPLPYPDPLGTDGGAPGLPILPPEIRAVTMSMAGFTVQFDNNVEYEKRYQTCTV